MLSVLLLESNKEISMIKKLKDERRCYVFASYSVDPLNTKQVNKSYEPVDDIQFFATLWTSCFSFPLLLPIYIQIHTEGLMENCKEGTGTRNSKKLSKVSETKTKFT